MRTVMQQLSSAKQIFESELLSSQEYNKALDLLKDAIKGLEYYVDKSITWTVEDFEQQAQVYEEQHDLPIGSYFDRSEFEHACETMISKHDANIGITWDTIDYYLGTHCIKEIEEE